MLLRSLLVSVCLAATVRAADPSLAASPSAFVRAQAASEVHWHAWNEATLAEARKAGRSVYVFIGSPLSELTRATVSQTFTSAKTVEWLNANFFCLFVDADAQPDLAMYGQHYIRSIKQLQGSPVHLWLTPELEVYDGANYLPPSEEWGKPGFLKAARSALDTWTGEPGRARALAREALDLMKVPPLEGSAMPDVATKLEAATKAWVAAADPVHGGFGTAPKQPEPELIRFLLTRDAAAKDAALKAARALVAGAVHAKNGGFYRRAIDEEWKEPYLQQTLADQARIALALFAAAEAGRDETLRAAAIGALDFALKELRTGDAFVMALDGTIEGSAPVRVGTASTAAQALFAVALQRSGEKRLAALAPALLRALPASSGGSSRSPMAADLLALSVGLKGAGAVPEAQAAVRTANEKFFDPATGLYQASPAPLPTGIALRVPAVGDVPSAESLALWTDVDAPTRALIRRALMSAIEYDDQPPGDVLLGLSQAR